MVLINLINNVLVSLRYVDWPKISSPQVKQNDNKVKSKTEKSIVECGKFTGNYKNDGVSGEFDSMTYPHSQEMLRVYTEEFLFTRI